MRDIVKVRKVGETIVITLTQEILSQFVVKQGDRLMVEVQTPASIVVTKED